MANEQSLYDEELLHCLTVDYRLPVDYMILRPLKLNDFNLGYLKLLAQLTNVGDVSEEQYLKQFNRMLSSGDYFVTVIEDINNNKLVAAATLFIEYKFIHGCGVRGRIEDVVVDSTVRGLKLGHVLIETLKQLAIKMKCYKLTLDCKDEMIPYYKKFGFLIEYGRSNMMSIRF